jgi:hypothetical protein
VASGTAAVQAGIANHPGIVRVTTSTTTNSGWQWTTDLTQILLSGGEESEFVFMLNATTNSTFRMGFLDSQSSTEPTDGAWISIIGTTLRGYCKNNAGPTSTASTYTVSTATWYRGYISVNSDASTVTFSLYNASGTQLWTDTVSANIPTARTTGHGIVGTNSGTSAISLYDIDFMRLTFNKGLSR